MAAVFWCCFVRGSEKLNVGVGKCPLESFAGRTLLHGTLFAGGGVETVLEAPLPLWEEFPQEGNTSEDGVCVPGRVALLRCPCTV